MDSSPPLPELQAKETNPDPRKTRPSAVLLLFIFGSIILGTDLSCAGPGWGLGLVNVPKIFYWMPLIAAGFSFGVWFLIWVLNPLKHTKGFVVRWAQNILLFLFICSAMLAAGICAPCYVQSKVDLVKTNLDLVRGSSESHELVRRLEATLGCKVTCRESRQGTLIWFLKADGRRIRAQQAVEELEREPEKQQK